MVESKVIAFKRPGEISEDPLTELLRTSNPIESTSPLCA